ncbi:MAG: hypothetical protein H7175_22810, partial [Burkholderiales bacterium]|nr:hypothetical protein [Anaerolineae bacterium]
ANLFKKLNTLVKASVNNALGDDLALGGSRRRQLTPQKLGKNIDREIEALRQRVNEALEYEDQLKAKARSVQAEVEQWDAQADAAVAEGRDEVARHAIEQMKRAQQRLTMAESDLNEHRFVTQELMLRVNELDAAVADARRAEAEKVVAAPPVNTTPETPDSSLADLLRDTRERIATEANAMKDVISAWQEPGQSQPQAQPEAAPTSPEIETTPEVEDDLARRRQRLSKPG